MAAVGMRLGQQLQSSTLLFPGSILGAPAPSPSRTSCGSQSVHALKKQSHSSSPKGSGGKGSIAEKSKLESGSRGGGGSQSSRKKLDSGSSLKLDESLIASLPMPKPPAGFILDEGGRVVLVAPAANRVVTIVDPATQRPLECMIRRAFRSSHGQDCLLLLPLDMPLQILKIEEESEGLRELSDEELQAVLPTAAYALAKRRLHLIISGFCLTARGGFCYTEEHVLDLNTGAYEILGIPLPIVHVLLICSLRIKSCAQLDSSLSTAYSVEREETQLPTSGEKPGPELYCRFRIVHNVQ